MKGQIQNSENLEIPSRWRRFSACLLDFIINFRIIGVIPFIIFTSDLNSDTTVFLIIVMITILLLILLYLIIIVCKKTTLGNKLVGISTVNNENNLINGGQAILRYFIFYTPFLSLILISFKILIWTISAPCSHGCGIKWLDTLIDVSNRLFYVALIFLSINIIEIFFKCPTFIDKRLGIKRLYNESK